MCSPVWLFGNSMKIIAKDERQRKAGDKPETNWNVIMLRLRMSRRVKDCKFHFMIVFYIFRRLVMLEGGLTVEGSKVQRCQICRNKWLNNSQMRMTKISNGRKCLLKKYWISTSHVFLVLNSKFIHQTPRRRQWIFASFSTAKMVLQVVFNLKRQERKNSEFRTKYVFLHFSPLCDHFIIKYLCSKAVIATWWWLKKRRISVQHSILKIVWQTEPNIVCWINKQEFEIVKSNFGVLLYRYNFAMSRIWWWCIKINEYRHNVFDLAYF